MQNLKNIMLALLVLFPATALAQSPSSKQRSAVAQHQEQQVQQAWFSKGDRYEWRNKKAPLKIIICEDELFPKRIIADYDSMPVVRDDSVFEARRLKDGHEWYPTYRVDKGYMKRLTDTYLRDWLKQTNGWLNYLSGGKFQLELEGIERVVTNYWNDKFSLNEIFSKSSEGFTMIVHPTAVHEGYYGGGGTFWINPLNVIYDKKNPCKYSIVPIHEILHSLLGPEHSPDSMSTAYTPSSHIFLTPREAAFLGWPVVKPKKLEKIKL